MGDRDLFRRAEPNEPAKKWSALTGLLNESCSLYAGTRGEAFLSHLDAPRRDWRDLPLQKHKPPILWYERILPNVAWTAGRKAIKISS